MADEVMRFLLTGTAAERQMFFARFIPANPIRVQDDTTFFTLLREDLGNMIHTAVALNLTLQELGFDHPTGRETYKMIHQGPMKGWEVEDDVEEEKADHRKNDRAGNLPGRRHDKDRAARRHGT